MTKLLSSLLLLVFLFSSSIQTHSRFPTKQPSNTIKQKKKHEDGRTMGPSLDWFTAARAYPGTALRTDGYTDAFEFMRSGVALRGGSLDEWQAIGPKNFGGRTLAIAFDPQNPNTVYAGTAGGGLWRSNTGGVGANAWVPVYTGFPVISASAVAIHPANPNTIFLGTGEVYNINLTGTGFAVWRTRGTYGIGILKSTDGGATWQKSLDWSFGDMRGVNKIMFKPGNNNILFACASDGVWRSTDAGASWTQVFSEKNVTDMVFRGDNPNQIMIGVGNLQSSGRGIYRSTNGGNTWTLLSGGLPSDFRGKIMLAADPSNASRVVAGIGRPLGTGSELIETWDFGGSWAPFGNAFYTYFWIAHDHSIRPGAPYDIVCSGVDTYKYDASGDTLVPKGFWHLWYGEAPPGGPEGPPEYIHADVHDIQRHPTNPDIIYFATDGGVFRSTDNGNTFAGCNGGLQTTQFYQGTSNSRQDPSFFLGGLQDNSTIVYEGDPAWRMVIGGDGGFTAINPLDDNIIFGSVYWGLFFKSTDKAQTFNPVFDGLSLQQANFIAPSAMSESNPDVLYLGCDSIFKTTDGGATWTVPNNDVFDNGRPANALVVSPTNPNKVYAASCPFVQGTFGVVLTNPPAKVLKTTDGGTTWQDISFGLPDRLTMDFAAHPLDDNIVYAAVGGFGTSHIFKTTDGGNTWVDVGGGLPDVPFNAVLIDPFVPNIIYAGCDLGLFVSEDAGATWQDFNQGLHDAVLVMDISASLPAKKLRIGTHGRGAWERPLLSDTSSAPVPDDPLSVIVTPNLVRDVFCIELTLARPGQVTLHLLSADGRLVQVLADGVYHASGTHRYQPGIGHLPAGVYYVVASQPNRRVLQKLVKI